MNSNNKAPSLHEVSSDYIDKMISNVKEMKAIILDKETQIIFSLEYSKSLALKQEIFLFENIEKITAEQKFNLSGIFFLRPTELNLKYLQSILQNLNFKEIHLYFSNQINDDYLNKIAQFDINLQIKTVQEVYFDYYISNSNVFHLNIESCIPNLSMTPVNQWVKYDEIMFDRIIKGLIAICLSNRMFPIIKCVKGSAISVLISKKVADFFQENYDFIKKECGKEPNGLLFIFDRKEDPVTPLINQWTYQAMLHELIGIKNNIITIKEKGKKEDKLVISDIEEIDKFFYTNMNNDYGMVANEVEKAAEKLKKENSELSKKDSSIEELKRIIESLPEKKKESMAITKHYKLFYELSEYINKHKLMDLSPIEQDIACNDNKKDQLNKIASVLPDEKVSALDKAKLYLLYVFRYEDDPSIPALKQLMAQNQMKEWIDYGELLIEYAGKGKRVLDVLSNKDFLSKGKKMFMNAFGSKENIFMQHVSYLNSIVDRLIKGRLGSDEIETILRANGNEVRPNKLIVFNFGGITYEETKDLTLLGKQLDIPIIAGGTNILNSKSFLAELLMAKKKKSDEVLIDFKE